MLILAWWLPDAAYLLSLGSVVILLITYGVAMCLTCDSMLFDYATGNCLGTTYFIWKVPDSCSATVLTAGNADCLSHLCLVRGICKLLTHCRNGGAIFA